MNQLIPIGSSTLPVLVVRAGERASTRFLEFFAATIRNPHTRRAYARAAKEFLTWCADAGVPSIAAVQPVHVATWIEAGMRELAAPSAQMQSDDSVDTREAEAGRGIEPEAVNHLFDPEH